MAYHERILSDVDVAVGHSELYGTKATFLNFRSLTKQLQRHWQTTHHMLEAWDALFHRCWSYISVSKDHGH